MRRGILIFIMTAFLLTPVPASADDTGLWIAGGAISLVYTPVKTAFFLLFGITGALSYLGTIPANRTDISEQWMKMGFYGDWLVRPDHLRGEDYPHFVDTKDEVHVIH